MSRTMYVSRNFRDDCSHETRSLGEAFPYIAAAEAKFTELLEALKRVQKCDSQDADTAASAMIDGLNELRRDASWGTVLANAEEAFAEADVTPIRFGEAAE